MADYIVRATAANKQIRAFAATTRELVEHARTIHNTSPVATAALGRLLTGGAMMGSMMKGEKDVLTVQMKGDGPIEGIIVTADSKANVKGYPGNPNVIIPPNYAGKLDVGAAIGYGNLFVSKDLGLKEPYNSQLPLTTSEVAEDLTYYFAKSEQVPSAVALGVLMEKDNTVKQAGGFIVQLMPFAEEKVIDALEQNVAKITSVTNYLERGYTPEMLLEEEDAPVDGKEDAVDRTVILISRRDGDFRQRRTTVESRAESFETRRKRYRRQRGATAERVRADFANPLRQLDFRQRRAVGERGGADLRYRTSADFLRNDRFRRGFVEQTGNRRAQPDRLVSEGALFAGRSDRRGPTRRFLAQNGQQRKKKDEKENKTAAIFRTRRAVDGDGIGGGFGGIDDVGFDGINGGRFVRLHCKNSKNFGKTSFNGARRPASPP